MARLFTKTDCSAFTYDTTGNLLTHLGRGELRLTRDVLENNALTDTWDSGIAGRARAEVTVELAGDDGATVHALAAFADGSGTLVLTTDAGAISGTFAVTEAGLTLEDALRETITFRSIGAVTIS